MVEMKNEGESLIYNTEKQLKENDSKLGQDVKDRIRADVASVNEAINANNAVNLKENLEKLRNSAMEMGRSIYQGQQSEGQTQEQNQEQTQEQETPKEETKSEETKQEEKK
jgi:molecular chaperone DnaK